MNISATSREYAVRGGRPLHLCVFGSDRKARADCGSVESKCNQQQENRYRRVHGKTLRQLPRRKNGKARAIAKR